MEVVIIEKFTSLGASISFGEIMDTRDILNHSKGNIYIKLTGNIKLSGNKLK